MPSINETCSKNAILQCEDFPVGVTVWSCVWPMEKRIFLSRFLLDNRNGACKWLVVNGIGGN